MNKPQEERGRQETVENSPRVLVKEHLTQNITATKELKKR